MESSKSYAKASRKRCWHQPMLWCMPSKTGNAEYGRLVDAYPAGALGGRGLINPTGQERPPPREGGCRDATRRARRRVLPRFSQKRVLPPHREKKTRHRDKNTPPLSILSSSSSSPRSGSPPDWQPGGPIPTQPPRAAMDGLHGTDACFSPARAMSPQVRPPGPPDVGR
jgi:hypothetical protein